MAALHEIARQYADEIRDGIAWVIIWKTGRSWHAESVWQLMDELTERFRKFWQYARKTADTFVDSLLYRANTHPKWWHLYKHARKWRTRKKYKRLLMKQLCSRLAAG